VVAYVALVFDYEKVYQWLFVFTLGFENVCILLHFSINTTDTLLWPATALHYTTLYLCTIYKQNMRTHTVLPSSCVCIMYVEPIYICVCVCLYMCVCACACLATHVLNYWSSYTTFMWHWCIQEGFHIGSFIFFDNCKSPSLSLPFLLSFQPR